MVVGKPQERPLALPSHDAVAEVEEGVCSSVFFLFVCFLDPFYHFPDTINRRGVVPSLLDISP